MCMVRPPDYMILEMDVFIAVPISLPGYSLRNFSNRKMFETKTKATGGLGHPSVWNTNT